MQRSAMSMVIAPQRMPVELNNAREIRDDRIRFGGENVEELYARVHGGMMRMRLPTPKQRMTGSHEEGADDLNCSTLTVIVFLASGGAEAEGVTTVV